MRIRKIILLSTGLWLVVACGEGVIPTDPIKTGDECSQITQREGNCLCVARPISGGGFNGAYWYCETP